MQTKYGKSRQRGAALIVGLMMLVIVTLLAVTAVSTSTTELVMAGNEQFRERATQAAEAGIENAILKARSGDSDVPKPGTAVNYLDNNNVAMPYNTADRVSTRLTAFGGGDLAPNSSGFTAWVFRVRSTGNAARNSQAIHEVGTWVLGPAGTKGGGDEGPAGGGGAIAPPGGGAVLSTSL